MTVSFAEATAAARRIADAYAEGEFPYVGSSGDAVLLAGFVLAGDTERLRTALKRELDHIGLALAVWCPHGFDSARSWDYDTAADIRAALDRIRAALAEGSP